MSPAEEQLLQETNDVLLSALDTGTQETCHGHSTICPTHQTTTRATLGVSLPNIQLDSVPHHHHPHHLVKMADLIVRSAVLSHQSMDVFPDPGVIMQNGLQRGDQERGQGEYL